MIVTIDNPTDEQIMANRRAWVEALRSGEYVQGRHALRTQHLITASFAYCCLGVACDITDRMQWVPDHHAHQAVIDGAESSTALPYPIERALGLSSAHVKMLMECNDTYNRSFDQIADKIERMEIAR